MNYSMSAILKKRTFTDTIISCILCIAAIVFSAFQIVRYISTDDPQHISNAVYCFIIFAELGLLSLILVEIRKTGRPFSSKIVTKLRIMAIVLMAGAIMPNLSNAEESSTLLLLDFDIKNLIIAFLGVIVGIISEIFVYGRSLQEDNDMIA